MGAVARVFGVPLLMGLILPGRPLVNENGEVVWKSLKAATRSSAIEMQTALDFLAKRKAST
jgi:hypothetical protein